MHVTVGQKMNFPVERKMYLPVERDKLNSMWRKLRREDVLACGGTMHLPMERKN